jgi:FPC/CPF motif-containing protein YcgG
MFAFGTPLLYLSVLIILICSTERLFMQLNATTKLGANVASKLASVLKHNDMTTTDWRQNLGSLVSSIRRKFSFTSGPFFPQKHLEEKMQKECCP